MAEIFPKSDEKYQQKVAETQQIPWVTCDILYIMQWPKN